MLHAVSPAVPAPGDGRVGGLRRTARLPLTIADAGSSTILATAPTRWTAAISANPTSTTASRSVTEGTVASGANLDDLGDYRPGLMAAAERGVVHPFVEAGIDKAGRAGARPPSRPGRSRRAAGPALPLQPGRDRHRHRRRRPRLRRAVERAVAGILPRGEPNSAAASLMPALWLSSERRVWAATISAGRRRALRAGPGGSSRASAPIGGARPSCAGPHDRLRDRLGARAPHRHPGSRPLRGQVAPQIEAILHAAARRQASAVDPP